MGYRNDRQGWLVEEERERIRKATRPSVLFRDNVRAFVEERPTLSAALALGLLLVLSLVAWYWTPIAWPELAPRDSAGAMQGAWQVHATFVAIAFAGLAILLQTSSADQLLTAERLRAVIYRNTHFPLVLAFSIGGAVELGIISNWLASDGGLIVQVVGIVLGSMVMIAVAYARTVRALTRPEYAAAHAVDSLIANMKDSIESSRAEINANGRVVEILGQPSKSNTDFRRELVTFVHPVTLLDVNGPIIEDVVEELNAYRVPLKLVDGSTPPEGVNMDEGAAPTLTMTRSIGSLVRSSKAIFVVENADKFKGDWTRLEAKLIRAVKTEQS